MIKLDEVRDNMTPPASASTDQDMIKGLTKFALRIEQDSAVVIKVLFTFGGSQGFLVTLVDTGSTFSLLDIKIARERLPLFETLFKAKDMPVLTLGDGVNTMKPLGVLENITFFFKGEN